VRKPSNAMAGDAAYATPRTACKSIIAAIRRVAGGISIASMR